MKPSDKTPAPVSQIAPSQVSLKPGETEEFFETAPPGSTIVEESGSRIVSPRTAARPPVVSPKAPPRPNTPGGLLIEGFAPSKATSPAGRFQVSPDPVTPRPHAPTRAPASAAPTTAQRTIVPGGAGTVSSARTVALEDLGSAQAVQPAQKDKPVPSLQSPRPGARAVAAPASPARAAAPSATAVVSPRVITAQDNTIRISHSQPDEPLRIVAPSLKVFTDTLSGAAFSISGKAIASIPSEIAVSIRDTLEKITSIDPTSLPLAQFASIIIGRHTGQALTPESLKPKITSLGLQAVIVGDGDISGRFETECEDAVSDLKKKFPNFRSIYLSQVREVEDRVVGR